MLRALTMLVVCGVAGVGQTTAINALTSKEKAAGWILLFDGSTMQGWDDPRLKTPAGDAWSIDEGCLKAKSKPRITEDLFSRQTFRDFELSWEWRIAPAGNSGLKYRIQDHLFVLPVDPANSKERFEARMERSVVSRVAKRPDHGQDYVIGFEYQMIDDSKNKDAINAKQKSGALYDMIAPSQAAARPAGEFNSSRIVLRGNRVEHWMNGVKVVDGSLDSPEAVDGIRTRWRDAPHVADLLAHQPHKDCPISLQNHGDEAWFRNIKIRPLQ